MDCKSAAQLFESLREGTLDGTVETALRDHLAGCKPCRLALGEMDLLERRLRGAMAFGRPSDHFAARTMEAVRLAGQPEPPGRPEWLMPAMLAAAACAVAALCVWPFLGPKPEPAEEKPYELGVIFHHQMPSSQQQNESSFPSQCSPGKAFVITHKGAKPYAGPTYVRVARFINGVPELVVDAFPEG